ncbi:PAS domain-containing sensor histidine kinase [Natronorubrum thiooxidans]|uniref:histidine kinase n=1 Tax=Natronorubrum thiooxidans TaxID=308853 RepID=A0A1N7CTA1_9EURY|nr:PAS domain S-box protein [Natronorubrum thiooxidans]SIR66886.1 PAS domain S-box-containing protein [Natronorubrum thiooxidans]
MKPAGGSARENAQPECIRVVHVASESTVAARTADGLEREDDRLETVTAATAAEALEYLEETSVDCIVSAYDIPDMDGLTFLKRVRTRDEDLPFVMFTANGSEKLASDAIAAGVTDYVRKDEETSQSPVLANRIVTAVEATRTRRQRTRQLQAIETAQEGISMLDSVGRFTYVNQSYADCFGYDPEELLGKHWDVLYEEDEATYVSEELLPTVMETGGWHGESVGVRADGSRIIVDHTLSRTEHDGLICTVRDITDRKERKHELERYETILEAIPDEVYVLDADGVFTAVIPPTDSTLTTSGYRPAELIGEHVSLILNDDDIAKGETEIRRLLGQDDREKASFELDLHTKDGDRIPNENHIALLPMTADERFQGTVGVLRDITDRKERERKLKRQNERLESFASIVSHDLRNPLNVAQGQLELAREQADNDHLEAVAASHERMQALIENLLTVAREEKPVTKTEPIDLETIARTCWRHVETADATLITATDAVVRGDRARLRRLLENLIRNSVEHGSTRSDSHTRQNSVEHGSTSSRPQADDSVEHGSTHPEHAGDGGDVTVTVGDLSAETGFYIEDDGPGIPPDQRDAVFEMGYSMAAGSTGLGLAIVERIAENHGWTVTVTESNAGGARFEFRDVNLEQ